MTANFKDLKSSLTQEDGANLFCVALKGWKFQRSRIQLNLIRIFLMFDSRAACMGSWWVLHLWRSSSRGWMATGQGCYSCILCCRTNSFILWNCWLGRNWSHWGYQRAKEDLDKHWGCTRGGALELDMMKIWWKARSCHLQAKMSDVEELASINLVFKESYQVTRKKASSSIVCLKPICKNPKMKLFTTCI